MQDMPGGCGVEVKTLAPALIRMMRLSPTAGVENAP